MMIILVIAVLLFGKRLPEVGRSLGKGLMEFKKGVRGLEDEVETVSSTSNKPSSHSEEEDREEATAPKFEPPPSEPTAETVEE
ncbi:MAG TPA: twin-arginine translocase TatA/TatE family subunit [Thermoguttaceae bacterium]|nr:twin-arginine translocase TatA/TatE family subunit [Thermoguttaceae bacterium]